MGRAVLVVLLLTAAPAGATPWSVTADTGAELDTNVQRVEGLTTTTLASQPLPQPVTAGVLRFGVRTEHTDHLLGGTYALAVSDLTRLVSNDTVDSENITVLAGDVRWLHRIG